MGKINKGILGGFSGAVGNVVGANWKGIDYMRIKAASVSNPRSEGQVEQRTKFITVLNFLKPISVFLRSGFREYAIKMTGFNSAMSYNIKNAVTGSYPNYTIDYASALVSRGDLTGAMNGTASSASVGQVTVDWNDNTGNGSAQATDKAMIVVYNPDKKEAIFTTDGPSRDTTTATLSVPDNYSGDTVQVYLAFISDDGQDVANSKHLGSVVVAS